MSSYFIYTLVYFLLAGCIVYPPTEFISAGLTIKGLFASWLGNEIDSFTLYHIKRSCITLLIHSMLPLGYFVSIVLFGYIDTGKVLSLWLDPLWLSCIACVVTGPLYVICNILKWSKDDWNTHPIAKSLAVYSNSNTTWRAVAADIDTEYRRMYKVIIDTNSITRVIAMDNWIIKVTSYKLYIAHQSDTALIVNKSDTHAMSPAVRGEAQFINIEVRPTRSGATYFNIRLNALVFKDLQDKVLRPITILQNVTFHKTLLDHFVETFKEQVLGNPFYNTVQELEQCIGCMQVQSNVKLSKHCENSTERSSEECTICYCRPMWCIECMAKWFASRQDENAPETWLSSKCTCPVCRAKFCLLDVCPVQTLEVT